MVGVKDGPGCNVLYATFCAQVRSAEAMMYEGTRGQEDERASERCKRVRGAVSVWAPMKIGITY